MQTSGLRRADDAILQPPAAQYAPQRVLDHERNERVVLHDAGQIRLGRRGRAWQGDAATGREERRGYDIVSENAGLACDSLA